MADKEEDGPPGFEPAAVNQAESSSKNESESQGGAVKEVTETVGELKIEGEEAEVDAPDTAIKSGALTDSAQEVKTEVTGDTIYKSAATFEDLGLSQPLLDGLYNEMKFEKPSKIQASTLPMILNPPYKNLIAQAHNGSGKTTCFVLAMLSRIDPDLKEPQAMCVCPTRELVTQNLQVLTKMGKYTSIVATSTADDYEQIRSRQTISSQVVIGTHGRLKNWYVKRQLSLINIKIVVFDEADEMLNKSSFADDSIRMLNAIQRARTGKDLQLLLFSATYNDLVRDFAEKVAGADTNKVFIPKEDLSLDVIKQFRVICPSKEDKAGVLKDSIFPQCEKLGQTIIFVRTRDTARSLHKELNDDGYRCTSIDGGMQHEDRDKVVREFRNGVTKILISTDVLSRGFDVTQVTLVVNYDVPTERDTRVPNYETYLHRIGRSGRFGRKGAAFNLLYGQREVEVMDKIQQYFEHDVPEVQYNDVDQFQKVLVAAGLSDG